MPNVNTKNDMSSGPAGGMIRRMGAITGSVMSIRIRLTAAKGDPGLIGNQEKIARPARQMSASNNTQQMIVLTVSQSSSSWNTPRSRRARALSSWETSTFAGASRNTCSAAFDIEPLRA